MGQMTLKKERPVNSLKLEQQLKVMVMIKSSISLQSKLCPRYETYLNHMVVYRKQNASERINLQDIMQLRTAFLTADDSGDGELSLKEVRMIEQPLQKH